MSVTATAAKPIVFPLTKLLTERGKLSEEKELNNDFLGLEEGENIPPEGFFDVYREEVSEGSGQYDESDYLPKNIKFSPQDEAMVIEGAHGNPHQGAEDFYDFASWVTARVVSTTVSALGFKSVEEAVEHASKASRPHVPKN